MLLTRYLENHVEHVPRMRSEPRVCTLVRNSRRACAARVTVVVLSVCVCVCVCVCVDAYSGTTGYEVANE